MLNEDEYIKLSKHLPLNINQELKELFVNNAHLISLKKGDTLTDELKTTTKSYVILNGSCVRYIITPEGEERAITFHTEGFIPIIGNSYIKSDYSAVTYLIKVNEPTELIEMDLTIIIKNAISDMSYVSIGMQNVLKFVSIQNQIQNHLIGLKKEEFLIWLIENYGFLFQRFSSKDIASFMNVSPTWLSLFKKKLTEKK